MWCDGTPTDYDPETNDFDTSPVQAVTCDVLRGHPQAVVVITSTVPMGFTPRMPEVLGCEWLLFSLKFLREGRALHDNL